MAELQNFESPRHTELAKYRLDAGDKYIYYLLSVTAACIALVVQMTLNSPLKSIHAVLGIAVCCWVVSFYFGCKSIVRLDAAISLNIQGMSLEEIALMRRLTINPQQKHNIRYEFELHAHKAFLNKRRQFNFLIVGVCFFLTYHIYSMAHFNAPSETPIQFNLYQEGRPTPSYIWMLQSNTK